jgi:hypothetical protein
MAPSSLPFFTSHNSPAPFCPSFCFHTLTTIKFCNPFVFKFIQIARGCVPPSTRKIMNSTIPTSRGKARTYICASDAKDAAQRPPAIISTLQLPLLLRSGRPCNQRSAAAQNASTSQSRSVFLSCTLRRQDRELSPSIFLREGCTLQRICPCARAPGFSSSLRCLRKSPTRPQATGFVWGT